jgi:hypothetical protein
MIFGKKGSEMSMNVIIIAAIALLVLVILAVMLMRQANNVDDATRCANSETEYCSTSAECIADKGFPQLDSGCKDGDPNKGFCCKKLSS